MKFYPLASRDPKLIGKIKIARIKFKTDMGSYEVTPCLPVDVLGVYVLLPASL